MDSQTAVKIFADEILDLVFLDGDHRYEYFKEDVLHWLPKIKEGGILCGHDCEGYYFDYPEKVRKIIDENLDKDNIPGVCHPGIIKALYEFFGKDYFIGKEMNSSVWWYIKKKSIF